MVRIHAGQPAMLTPRQAASARVRQAAPAGRDSYRRHEVETLRPLRPAFQLAPEMERLLAPGAPLQHPMPTRVEARATRRLRDRHLRPARTARRRRLDLPVGGRPAASQRHRMARSHGGCAACRATPGAAQPDRHPPARATSRPRKHARPGAPGTQTVAAPAGIGIERASRPAAGERTIIRCDQYSRIILSISGAEWCRGMLHSHQPRSITYG